VGRTRTFSTVSSPFHFTDKPLCGLSLTRTRDCGKEHLPGCCGVLVGRMDLVLKFLAFLLIPLIASCASSGGIGRKDPPPCCPGPSALDRNAAPMRTTSPGSVTEIPALCSLSCTPDRPVHVSPPERPNSCNTARLRNGQRNARIPELHFPVPSGILSSPFGLRRGTFHCGLDIKAPKGVPVLACAEGKVAFAGTRKGYRSYGQAVLIDHGRDVCTHYAHLSKILVKKGETVRRGQRIALVGSTGRSTCPHLHLEVREGKQLYNPVAYFNPQRLRAMQVAASYWHTPMGPVRSRRGMSVQKRPNSSPASL